jgi:hypothetical protein
MDCNYLTDVFQSVACMFFREQALTNVLKGRNFHNRRPAACGEKHLHRHCPEGQDCSGKSCLYRQRYGYRLSAGCVSLARGYEDIACSGNDNIPCLTGNRQLTRLILHISLPSQLPSMLPSIRREASRLYTARSIHRPAINYSLLTVNYSLNKRNLNVVLPSQLPSSVAVETRCFASPHSIHKSSTNYSLLTVNYSLK